MFSTLTQFVTHDDSKKPPRLTNLHINPSPNDKTLNVTKLKAFADKKSDVDKMTISLFVRVENNEGKRNNAGYQHIFLFPSVFQSFLL